MASRPTNVVDFQAFRAARTARATGQLDLLEPVPSAAAPSRALPPGDADQPLTDRNLAHRARMLAHLLSARS